jgi:hypothetical protein
MRLAGSGLALAALLLCGAAVRAEERPLPVAAKPAPSAARVLLGKRVADQALAQQRGGADLASDAVLKGVVSDNQAVNVTTGGNLITGGAFAGASGVPVVIQNSGNNVLIQSSTIVNVQLK